MTEADNKNLDDDYLDMPDEFESDVDDTDDFDDTGDDDIFTADKPKGKKSGSKIIAGVILLVLAAGGGFYFYSQQDATVTPQVEDVAAAPAIEAPSDSVPADIPAVPTAVSDFAPETPPEVPTEKANGNLPSVPEIPQNDTTQTASDINQVAADGPPVIAGSVDSLPQKAAVQDPVANPVKETKIEAEPADSDAPVEVVPPAAQAKASDKKQPDASALNPVRETPIENAAQAPLPLPKKNELEVAREQVNMKPKEAEKTVYFDSPKGKALLDIPPPSINPMQQPGESIIIVHKGNRDASDVIVTKGDDSDWIESKLVNARRASGLGFNDAALDFYNELYQKNPRDPRILMGRAVTLQKLGETEKAIDGYQDVLNVQPDNAEAITNLMGLIGKTQPAVAMQNLLELREKYPRNATVAAQLGIAYSQSGNPQDGLKYLNIASGLQPKNPLHYYNMAIISEHLNDRANAIKYYEQALDTYSVNGNEAGANFPREEIYDRLAGLRGN